MSIPSKVFAFFFMSPSTTNSLLAFNTYERFFFFTLDTRAEGQANG